MIHRPLSICLGFVVSLAAGMTAEPVHSQSDEQKYYRVEVIAFQHIGPDGSGGEAFPDYLVEDYLPKVQTETEEVIPIERKFEYTPLLELAPALERLYTDEHYRVLNYAAWIQPLVDRENTIDVPLGYTRYGQEPGQTSPAVAAEQSFYGPEIAGVVRVYGDYLLFMDLDLRAVIPRTAPVLLPATQTEQGGTVVIQRDEELYDVGADSGDRLRVYRLHEKRRIKLGEHHYFDHPFVGAVAIATRYEGPVEGLEAEPLGDEPIPVE